MSVKLKPEMFWEWKCSIEQMQHQQTKLKHTRLYQSLLEKDIEIQKLKADAFKKHIKEAEQVCEDGKSLYEALKKKIEDEIGFSLNDCTIDEYTFEVKNVNNLDDKIYEEGT